MPEGAAVRRAYKARLPRHFPFRRRGFKPRLPSSQGTGFPHTTGYQTLSFLARP